MGRVADRIDAVLPQAEAEAFRRGLDAAASYLQAVGATVVAPPTVEGPSGALPWTTVSQEQLVAVAKGNGFASFANLPRVITGQNYTLQTATQRWQKAQETAIRTKLEEGFLTGRTTGQMVADLRAHLSKATHAQVEALVRTSTAQAAQTAHDAFYEANEDALGDKDGNRYVWDASNDGRLCPKCAPLDGTRYKNREDAPWPAHWVCRCKILPVTPLTDELGALPNTYLESTPAQYDEKGKLLPPPKGYDQAAGDPGFSRPRRVNGVMVWQRRAELPAGKTTAGHMLQRANDATALPVLGSRERLARFRALTKPGARFYRDPQGAVIELLRPDGGLPPGAVRVKPQTTRPRRTSTPKTPPKPKPAAQPAQDEAAATARLGRDLQRRVAPGMAGRISALKRARALERSLYDQQVLRTRTLPRKGTEITKAISKNEQRISRLQVQTFRDMQAIQKEMLKTPLTDAEVRQLVEGVDLSTFGKTGQTNVRRGLTEYVRMFNGQGLTASPPETQGIVARVNKLIDVHGPYANGRGYMNTVQGYGAISGRLDGKRLLFHELTHTTEAQRPWMGRWAQEWAAGRAWAADDARLRGITSEAVYKGKPLVNLADINPFYKRASRELALVDEYMSYYMGKIYGHTAPAGAVPIGGIATEVWTMAVESFESYDGMIQLATAHPDLFQMVLGLSQRR
jgi:SPP1 gp7 family putative phage head morphogenesis protein